MSRHSSLLSNRVFLALPFRWYRDSPRDTVDYETDHHHLRSAVSSSSISLAIIQKRSDSLPHVRLGRADEHLTWPPFLSRDTSRHSVEKWSKKGVTARLAAPISLEVGYRYHTVLGRVWTAIDRRWLKGPVESSKPCRSQAANHSWRDAVVCWDLVCVGVCSVFLDKKNQAFLTTFCFRSSASFNVGIKKDRTNRGGIRSDLDIS